MQNQRIRNLSTGIVHTTCIDAQDDIDYLTGSDKIMRHMLKPLLLPIATEAIKPYIKKFASDPRFWNSEFDQSHSGETEIPQMNDDEEAAFWQRYEELQSFKMKPSEKCKNAGLKGLAELVEISKFKYRTLLYCAKNNPDKFDFVVKAAGAEKANKVKEIG